MSISPELAAERWRPVGVDELEPTADRAVRSMQSTLLVAGPGAGKTELLAQRACFLLQTGRCSDPHRILAISFKRDAARNLQERVANRCGRGMARRFDSYTFDSFSKALVDRFLLGVPDGYRPQAGYEVLTDLVERRILDYVHSIPSAGSRLGPRQRHGLNERATWEAFIGRGLPISGGWTNGTDEEVAAEELWRFLLHGRTPSGVAFPMLGRIAELMLRSNPRILDALRSAYRYVFLDEFQDTTRVQYALVETAFSGSATVLTAVGDKKQRIMGWAGAMERAFEKFAADFGAETLSLTRNYRSAPELVRIQSVIARALDASASAAVAMRGEDMPSECRILTFRDDASEAQGLAARISEWLRGEELSPRDVCVLCRMKPKVYTERLQAALEAVGVRSRLENELQDLLAEPLSECVLDYLKLACRASAPESWGRALSLISGLRGNGSEASLRRIVDDLLVHLEAIRSALDAPSTTAQEVTSIVHLILRHVGEDAFRATYPQYLQGTWYTRTVESLVSVLVEARRSRSWSEAIDEVEGIDSVPIMTTHKSKGLEYHTIVFVGLEDQAHFGFARDQIEEMCGFFVALSRAKRRAVFTFAGVRPTGRGGARAAQGKEVIRPLYDLLAAAGVVVEAGDGQGFGIVGI